MHLIHHPDGTASTIFAGKAVYRGTPAQAATIGRQLEWGERCPNCLARIDCRTEQHCLPVPERPSQQPTNGRHKVVA